MANPAFTIGKIAVTERTDVGELIVRLMTAPCKGWRQVGMSQGFATRVEAMAYIATLVADHQAAIPLPDLPARHGWRGIIVEEHEVAGCQLVAATIKTCLGRSARRPWFTDRPAALVFAAQEAETGHLSIFDLGEGGSE